MVSLFWCSSVRAREISQRRPNLRTGDHQAQSRTAAPNPGRKRRENLRKPYIAAEIAQTDSAINPLSKNVEVVDHRCSAMLNAHQQPELENNHVVQIAPKPTPRHGRMAAGRRITVHGLRHFNSHRFDQPVARNNHQPFEKLFNENQTLLTSFGMLSCRDGNAGWDSLPGLLTNVDVAELGKPDHLILHFAAPGLPVCDEFCYFSRWPPRWLVAFHHRNARAPRDQLAPLEA